MTMNKPDLLKAIEALKAEVEKKPEDRVLEKLDEILKAIQALPHFYPGCCGHHYHQYPWVWASPTITVSGGTSGTTGTNANGGAPFTLTNGSTAEA